MRGINTFCMGRLTADPELRSTERDGETSNYCTFSLAIEHKFKTVEKDGKKRPAVDFVNCIVGGKSAEFLSKFGRKGRIWSVVGCMESKRDAEKKVTYWTLRADSLGPVAPSEWPDRDEDTSSKGSGDSSGGSGEEEENPLF